MSSAAQSSPSGILQTGLAAVRPIGTGTVLAAVTVALACGDPLRPEDTPDISGAWSYSETASAGGGDLCSFVGTLSFEQDGQIFVGSYVRTATCVDVGQSIQSTVESGPLSGGQVQERSLEFRLGGCDYRGTLSEREPDRLTGSSLCVGAADVAATASVQPMTGSWHAERLDDPTP